MSSRFSLSLSLSPLDLAIFRAALIRISDLPYYDLFFYLQVLLYTYSYTDPDGIMLFSFPHSRGGVDARSKKQPFLKRLAYIVRQISGNRFIVGGRSVFVATRPDQPANLMTELLMYSQEVRARACACLLLRTVQEQQRERERERDNADVAVWNKYTTLRQILYS